MAVLTFGLHLSDILRVCFHFKQMRSGVGQTDPGVAGGKSFSLLLICSPLVLGIVGKVLNIRHLKSILNSMDKAWGRVNQYQMFITLFNKINLKSVLMRE